MNKVFICSPFRGNVKENKEIARRACALAMKEDLLPVAPHLFFPQFLDDDIPEERNKGLYAGMELLKECAEVWVIGNQITAGMAAEIRRAAELEIPIRCLNDPEVSTEKLLQAIKDAEAE